MKEYEAIAEAMNERVGMYGAGIDEVEVELNNGKIYLIIEYRYEFEERLYKGDYYTPDSLELVDESYIIKNCGTAYDEQGNEVETSFNIAMLANTASMDGIRIN